MPTAPPHVAGNDTVSQSEIEKLLAQVGSTDALPEEVGALRPVASGDQFAPRHEFPPLSVFSQTDLRKLRVRHEDFIAALSARLSVHLALEAKLQMTRLETCAFQNFADGLANPTHLSVLKIENLPGHCLLDIPLRLGLALLDRELGGPGVWNEEPRELTKMETAIISKIVENILSEWCKTWRDLLELRPAIASVESNSRFLETCPPDHRMLIVAMEVRIGALVEQIHLAFPCTMLEPLVSKLNILANQTQHPAAARKEIVPRWNPLLNDMPIHVTAELPGLEMTAQQLARLKPGDQIKLPSHILGQVRVLLEGTPRYVGALGTSENRWAVQISSPIKA